MIVELFGAPAAGKTTLAHALATALAQDGGNVGLVVSSRPAERGPIELESTRPMSRLRAAAAAPLSRATKLLSALPILLGVRQDTITANLLDLMPPRRLLQSVRYRRYLSLLSSSWQTATMPGRITIFDQGFLTALCSLCLLTGCTDRTDIGRGLKLIPRPNLLVHLSAPRQILEARLRQRLDRQGAIERLFELDMKTNLQKIETTREMVHLLEQQGFPIMHVSCLDRRDLEGAVKRIVQEVKLRKEEIGDSPQLRPCPAGSHSHAGARPDRFRARIARQRGRSLILLNDRAPSEFSDDAQF